MDWFRCPICNVDYTTRALADGCRAGHAQSPTHMFQILGKRPAAAPAAATGEPETIATLTATDRHRILRNSLDRRSLCEEFRDSLRDETRRYDFDSTDAPWAFESGHPATVTPDPEGGWAPC